MTKKQAARKQMNEEGKLDHKCVLLMFFSSVAEILIP